MNLPKLETPKYQLTVPSTQKEIDFRPFLVKEEKILLIAQESGKESDYIRAMRDIIASCIFNNNIVNDLTSFDLEYIFLKLRSKSVGEIVDIGIVCEECEERNTVKINLDEISVTKTDPLPNKIELTDTIGIIPKYIKIDSLIKIADIEDQGDILTETIAATVESIYDESNVYPISEASDADIKEFVDSLNKEQLEKIENVATSAPKVQETVSFECKDCKAKNEKVLAGIENFFV
jgi:hypothetical protein